MGIFSRSSNNNGEIDFKRLRADLMDEYGAQMAAYSGGFGFLEMYDAQDATEDQLLEMARREGINLNKYRK
ncbi:MAG: hypothetical protein J6N70_11855 [Oribacterium sp.]|nr:hypothetical protein [Oribacterium sp.]MBP3817988.1 hypothetical protein [Butyrivibrio sp.]